MSSSDMLRQKLGDDCAEPQIIPNEPGMGCRFLYLELAILRRRHRRENRAQLAVGLLLRRLLPKRLLPEARSVASAS
jgi:hypothetical protein